VALRGQAQGILGDLPIDKQQDYKSLVKALEERFAPPNQTELYRVHGRRVSLKYAGKLGCFRAVFEPLAAAGCADFLV
jgi:hypothetical protein